MCGSKPMSDVMDAVNIASKTSRDGRLIMITIRLPHHLEDLAHSLIVECCVSSVISSLQRLWMYRAYLGLKESKKSARASGDQSTSGRNGR